MRLLTIFILAGKLCKPITLLYTSMGFTTIAAGVLAIGGEKIVHLFYLGKQTTLIISTGCKSQFRKIFGLKIWKDPMLAL